MAPSPVPPGGDTTCDAGMQSLLTAAMGLTSLGATISPSTSSSSQTRDKASMESDQSENRPAVAATSALAAPSPPIFKKSPAGVGNLKAPCDHLSKDATMAMDQFSASGQMVTMTSAAIDAPPASRASRSQGSDAPLPTRALKDSTMAMDQLSSSGEVAAANSAAIDAPSPGRASRSRGSEAPLPIPSSLSKLPAHDPIEPVTSDAKSFPETLLEVLSSEEHSDVIAWLPHGRGFVVINKERFALSLLPRYFDGSKFSSFTRRMKRWGFNRVPRGPEMGAYYHPGFRRDRPELVREMKYPMGKREGGERRKTGKEGAAKLREQVDKAVVKKLVEEAVERQVQRSLAEKAPTQPNSEADVHVLQSQAEYSPPHVRSEHIPMDAWLPANRSPQGQGRSILLPSASPVQRRLSQIERELLLSRSLLSREAPDYLAPGSGATAASARARSAMARGSISNQRPYCAPTYDVQRMIDVERAKCTLEAERNAIDAIMASEVLASSRINADIMDAGFYANRHAMKAAIARKNTAWLETQADLLRSSSFPLRIPDSRAPIGLGEQEQRMAEIQRELLLTESMKSREVDDYLATGSSANGIISHQRPYSAPAYDVQRMIDLERARRALEAESISGLRTRRSPAPTGRANTVEMMASKVLTSSKIHANIMDAVARDLYSRSKPAPPAAVPSTELSP